MENLTAEPPLRDVIAQHVHPDVDLVVCEGYKSEPHPKIEVAHAAISTELVLPEGTHLAVVCDFPAKTSAPIFSPDQADAVADLIIERVVRR